MLGIVFEQSFLDMSSAGINESTYIISSSSNVMLICIKTCPSILMSSNMYQVAQHVSWYGWPYAERYHDSSSPGNNDLDFREYFVWIRWNILSAKQEYIETGPAIINKKCISLGMQYSNPSLQSLIFFVKLTAIRFLSIDNLFREENENYMYRRITTLAF